MTTGGSPSTQARRADQRFFTALAIFFTLFVFVGFARTYYLRSLFGQPAPVAFIQFHAIVMSGWIVLLLVQTLLVRRRRVQWHRQLGVAGICYATAMIPIGCGATLLAAAREVRAHSDFMLSQLNVLGLELTQMLLFAGFITAAVLLRDRPDHHKRLIIVATLCLLPNVIVRLMLPIADSFFGTNLGIMLLWTLLVLAVVGADWVRNRRLHPAFAYGAPLSIAAIFLAWTISKTQVWDHFWIHVLA